MEKADSRGSEQAEQERTEYWAKNVAKHVKFIAKHTRELSDRNLATEFPLAEEFRLERLPEDLDENVDEARG